MTEEQEVMKTIEIEVEEATVEQEIAETEAHEAVDDAQVVAEGDPVYEHIVDVLFTIVNGQQQAAGAFGDWLDVAEEANSRLPYEMKVAALQTTREGEDTNAWVAGYIVDGMVAGSKHGQKEKMYEDLARDTGRSVHDLRAKADTASFWPPHIVKTLMDKDEARVLSWSHFDKARRGLELAEAEAMLTKAIDNSWSVRQFEAERLNARNTGKTMEVKKAEFAIRALMSLGKENYPGTINGNAIGLISQLEAYVSGN